MKELIEQARGIEGRANPLVQEIADALEQQAKQIDQLLAELAASQEDAKVAWAKFGEQCVAHNKTIEELAAALAAKDSALIKCSNDFYALGCTTKNTAERAIEIQPHAALVAKIKAEVLRKAAVRMPNFKGEDSTSQLLWLVEEADRIEKGEVE